MCNLLNKELRLSINKFFYILPLLVSLLFFIPGWIYSIVFMYFFWIAVPQIFSAFLTQRDYEFTSTLPVTKKEVVIAKSSAIFIIEGIHVFLGAIFAVVHNYLYGTWNLFMDANFAFFGVVVLMFGVFNLVFLPRYFKTAYYFGKPLIISTVVLLVYGFIFEFGAIKYQFVRDILEGSIQRQLIILAIGIVLGVFLSIISAIKSIKNYESIK